MSSVKDVEKLGDKSSREQKKKETGSSDEATEPHS